MDVTKQNTLREYPSAEDQGVVCRILVFFLLPFANPSTLGSCKMTLPITSKMRDDPPHNMEGTPPCTISSNQQGGLLYVGGLWGLHFRLRLTFFSSSSSFSIRWDSAVVSESMSSRMSTFSFRRLFSSSSC